MTLRDAATVVLVRNANDGAPGFEVFMLLRTVKSDFNAGAYVFPGGGVDRSDGGAQAERVCSGLDARQASARLGIADGGLAFYLAAIRECFEEAGVLLAADASGQTLSLREPATQQRFTAYRAALNAGQTTLAAICEREHLRLPLDQVHYYSHWITPEGMPRRYDTRFSCAGRRPVRNRCTTARKPSTIAGSVRRTPWRGTRPAASTWCRRRASSSSSWHAMRRSRPCLPRRATSAKCCPFSRN